MEEESKNTEFGSDLPFDLPEEQWGRMVLMSEECPGVYYLATQDGDSLISRELYVVMKKAIPGIISMEAASYGIKTDNAVVFEYERPGSGWLLVKFEILRYKTRKGLPTEEDDTLYSAAAFAIDVHPSYFGGCIPPRMTPWGPVVRVKRAEEGIFFLETTNCEWILATSFVVWESELSDAAKQYGVTCEYDKLLGVQEAEYLYFRRDKCAAALLELTEFGKNPGCQQYIASREVLETHVYTQMPEYAIWYNRWQAADWGSGCFLRELLISMGCEWLTQEEPESVRQGIKKHISFSEELADKELLMLPT